MSFDLIRSSGPFIRDPRRLPRYSIDDANLQRHYNASSVAANTASFYTGGPASIDRIPGSATTNTSWTADVYKTVLSYTGSGLLCNLVTHVPTTGTPIFTFRITLDGVVYTFTARTPGDSDLDRVVIGHCLPFDAYHAPTNYVFAADAASSDGFTANLNSTSGLMLPGPLDPRIPYLVAFDSSILVEWKCSVGASSSGATIVNRAAAIVLAQS